MCLIAFAIGASPHWPLVIASNRDEFLERPTAPLARWTSANEQVIVSGRDLRAGGTWLGMTPGGRVGFLTNVREAPGQTSLATARSRGDLVLRWLDGLQNASDINRFTQELQDNADDYAGFNLVLGDFQQNTWTWLSNRPADAGNAVSASAPKLHVQTLAPGVYGLSNASLDTPWPKTTALKAALSSAIEAPTLIELQTPLWSALASRQQDNKTELTHNDVSLAMEAAFSSAFVDVPDRAYGTRCSTLLVAKTVAPSGIESGIESKNESKEHWDVQIEERTHVRGTSSSKNSNPLEASNEAKCFFQCRRSVDMRL